MGRSLLLAILPVVWISNAEASGALAGLGSVAKFATPFLPAELRGVTGMAATAAMANAYKAKGIIEFVTDGTDYPWICLCPTADQIGQLKKLGATVAPNKCPEDQKMGCQPPQVDMSSAPLPQVKGATEK